MYFHMDVAMHYSTSLAINRLRLSVKLGVTAGEQSKLQPVELDIRFYFAQLPGSCDNDGNEFLCYDKLSQAIMQLVDGREFRLIEYLTMEIYREIRRHVETRYKGDWFKHMAVWIRLNKCAVPLPHVLGGTSFTYCDLPPDAVVSAVE